MQQKNDHSSQLVSFLFGNARLLSMLLGSFFMCAWAMLRFFTKTSNFDLVGQQVLAHQWLTGLHGGAIIGPTNYVFKIFLLYMPLDVLHVSPRGKLIFMTLLIAIVTYILFIILLEKLWKLFYNEIPKTFYIAMLWLPLAAGSIFWIQFTNSRNIEVIGGMLFVYLMLRLKTVPSVRQFLVLVGVSGILFFADPLQMYMTALPATVYIALLSFRERARWQVTRITAIIASIGAGLVVSKLLTLGIEAIFKVNFLVATDHRIGSIFTTLAHSVVPLAKQTARLYVGGYEYGRIIEVLNILFVVGIIMLSIWYVWKRVIPRKLGLLVGVFWLTNAAVYTVSGQALQSGTSRYLIMTTPFFAMLVAAVISARTKYRSFILVATTALLCVNSITLTYMLVKNWNPKFTKDIHSHAAIEYMKSHNYKYGYASMDTALPTNYFSAGTIQLLPVKCETGNIIQVSYLFFDETYYKYIINTHSDTTVPLILDGDSITNYPIVCSEDDLRARLGEWQRKDRLQDGSSVLLYDAQQIRQALHVN